MVYTFDSTIGAIMSDPKAQQVIDKYIPGASTNPMLSMVRDWSINTILSMPQASLLRFTRQKAQSILDEINRNSED